MSTKIVLELNDQDYDRLEGEAKHWGVAAEELAGNLVRESLPADRLTDEQIREGFEALAWFREFRQTLPVADVGPILEASRAELEQRPYLWPKSSTATS